MEAQMDLPRLLFGADRLTVLTYCSRLKEITIIFIQEGIIGY